MQLLVPHSQLAVKTPMHPLGPAHGALQVLCRPLRLWLHLLAQAGVLAHTASCTPSLCGAPVFQHPFARRATGTIYSSLSALLSLALPPAAQPPRHGPLGQCRAVLALEQLILTFLAPSLPIVAWEAAAYIEWKHYWLAWQQQQAADLGGAGPDLQAASLSTASASAASAVPAMAAVGGAAVECTSQLDTVRHPFLVPPSWAAVRVYEVWHACQLGEALDRVVAAAVAGLLLCSAWHVVLLLTPP